MSWLTMGELGQEQGQDHPLGPGAYYSRDPCRPGFNKVNVGTRSEGCVPARDPPLVAPVVVAPSSGSATTSMLQAYLAQQRAAERAGRASEPQESAIARLARIKSEVRRLLGKDQPQLSITSTTITGKAPPPPPPSVWPKVLAIGGAAALGWYFLSRKKR